MEVAQQLKSEGTFVHSGFLSRRSDDLECTARFVAWSDRRVWTF